MNNAFAGRIAGVNGCVSITPDGETRDILLAGGECFMFDRKGPALGHACEPSIVSIQEPSCAGVPGKRNFDDAMSSYFCELRREEERSNAIFA
jgi:hypothetical protein